MEETIIEVDTDNTTIITINMLATRMDSLEEVKEVVITLNITNTMASMDISNSKVLVTIKVIKHDKYA
jgi:hypothetical protein